MTKDRACANGPAMPRRSFLTALPAAGAAMALPANALAVHFDTPCSPELWAKFQEWLDLHHRIDTASESEMSNEEKDAACVVLAELDRGVEAMPVQCAADVVAKHLCCSAFGGYDYSGTTHDMIAVLGLQDDPRAEA